MPENQMTRFFSDLIQQTGSYDIALDEFRRLIAEDEDLRLAYRQWCEDNGYTERMGFSIFCDECISLQNSAMESLNNEYDDI